MIPSYMLENLFGGDSTDEMSAHSSKKRLEKILSNVPKKVAGTALMDIDGLSGESNDINSVKDHLTRIMVSVVNNAETDPEILKFSRMIAYELAQENPVKDEKTHVTAFKYYYTGRIVTVYEGDLSEDDFINGKFMVEVDNYSPAIFPFIYTNSYDLLSFVRDNFFRKYKYGRSNNGSTELEINSAVYKLFLPYQILLTRLEAMVNNPNYPVKLSNHIEMQKLFRVIENTCMLKPKNDSSSCFQINFSLLSEVLGDQGAAEILKDIQVFLKDKDKLPVLLHENLAFYYFNDDRRRLDQYSVEKILEIINAYDDVNTPDRAKILIDHYKMLSNNNNNYRNNGDSSPFAALNPFSRKIQNPIKRKNFLNFFFAEPGGFKKFKTVSTHAAIHAIEILNFMEIKECREYDHFLKQILPEDLLLIKQEERFLTLCTLSKLLPQDSLPGLFDRMPASVWNCIRSMGDFIKLIQNLGKEYKKAFISGHSQLIRRVLNSGEDLILFLENIKLDSDFYDEFFEREIDHIKHKIKHAFELNNVLHALKQMVSPQRLILKNLEEKLGELILKDEDLEYLFVNMMYKDYDLYKLVIDALRPKLEFILNEESLSRLLQTDDINFYGKYLIDSLPINFLLECFSDLPTKFYDRDPEAETLYLLSNRLIQNDPKHYVKNLQDFLHVLYFVTVETLEKMIQAMPDEICGFFKNSRNLRDMYQRYDKELSSLLIPLLLQKLENLILTEEDFDALLGENLDPKLLPFLYQKLPSKFIHYLKSVKDFAQLINYMITKDNVEILKQLFISKIRNTTDLLELLKKNQALRDSANSDLLDLTREVMPHISQIITNSNDYKMLYELMTDPERQLLPSGFKDKWPVMIVYGNNLQDVLPTVNNINNINEIFHSIENKFDHIVENFEQFTSLLIIDFSIPSLKQSVHSLILKHLSAQRLREFCNDNPAAIESQLVGDENICLFRKKITETVTQSLTWSRKRDTVTQDLEPEDLNKQEQKKKVKLN